MSFNDAGQAGLGTKKKPARVGVGRNAGRGLTGARLPNSLPRVHPTNGATNGDKYYFCG